MGRKCCVTGCTSNYDRQPGHTSCFKFPLDEQLKDIWLKNIPRQDTFNTQNVGVCILHFDSKFIKTVNETDHRPLVRPRLTKDAVPTIFRFNVDGISKMFNFEPITMEPLNADLIRDFMNFKNGLATQVEQKDWLSTSNESCVSFFKLRRESNGNLNVQFNVNIDKDLNIQIFHENNVVDYSFYREIVPRHQRLNFFSELNRILEKCDSLTNVEDDKATVNMYLKYALDNLTEAKRFIANVTDYEYANCVNILHDQLIQLTQSRRRYSVNTILCAYILYIQSSKTYELIREWCILLLPSKSTLQKMARFQDVNPDNQASNLNYLKKVVSNLTDKEKFVIVQIDEIYSNPQVVYWNKLTGFAENTDEVATTVLGVLVSSCFGTMKEIVNLIPLKNATGKDLEKYAREVTNSLQSLGLIVLAFVTDNHRINQNLFSLLAPDGSYSFQNPKYSDRVIRLLYDSIHIFKNVRNNWVNKKDEEKSFFYPKFDDNETIIQQASFKDIRDLYHSEKLKMIKTAPKLNTRSLYPSNFDRQRVPLALNIIHPTTISALKLHGYKETAEFLEVIKVWFTIMNNTTKKMEIGIGDEKWFEPITSPDGFQVAFLKKFVDWLKRWKDLGLDLHVGGLTNDTFVAAITCTEGMIKLIADAFRTCKIDTFLPGEIQTNDLEKRFGRYRELSGCNYNVSIKQIMESEKKLRIKTIISSLPHELITSKYVVKNASPVDLTEYLDLLDSDYINNFTGYDHASFIYISGYAGYTMIKKLDCDLCRNLIIKSKGGVTGNDYFDYLQNGGLIEPTENCIFLLLHMHALFDELRKDVEKRRVFQFSDNPRSILVMLTLEGIARSESFVVDWDNSCMCGETYKNLFVPLLSVFANILLNNYRKKINDMNMLRKMNKSTEKKKKKAEENKENIDCTPTKKMKVIHENEIKEKVDRKCEIYKKVQ